MIKPNYPLKALLIITSPEYNEKLNEFLLDCDWEGLHKKWNLPRENDDEEAAKYRIPVEFMFFEEQSNWKEAYQEAIDAAEISPRLLERYRPFNVLKKYMHHVLKLKRIDKPKFIFLPLIPYLNDDKYLNRITQEEDIDLSADTDLYQSLEDFLEKSLAQYERHAQMVLKYQERDKYSRLTGHNISNTIRGQEGHVDYGELTIAGLQKHIKQLKTNLQNTSNPEQKIITQIQIDALQEKFLSGKLSVGSPIIEISNKDRIMIVGHVDASFFLNRAKDKALYFYLLMRAKQGRDFVAFEDIQNSAWDELADLHREIQSRTGHNQEFSINDRKDFSQMVSRINKKFNDNIAKHLVGGYFINAVETAPKSPKYYGIQTEPHRIKIDSYSSLGLYMKSSSAFN